MEERKVEKIKNAVLFLGPTLVAYFVIFVVPFFMGIYLSFASFTSVNDAVFVGLNNYKSALNPSFLGSLFLTTVFSALSVITVNLFAFLLALLLSQKLRGKNFFRTVFFMPNLIGGIVLGYIWQVIFNGILYYKGLSLTSDPAFGFFGLLILMNWQMIGYMMVIYIAAITNIDEAMLEAARVDGASYKNIVLKIIVPSLTPAFTVCLFLTFANSFKLFDQNLALTAGAPSGKTELAALNIYNTFYGSVGKEGIAQAQAVIFFIICAVFAFLQLYFTSKKENEVY